jgi:hypothetical protein
MRGFDPPFIARQSKLNFNKEYMCAESIWPFSVIKSDLLNVRQHSPLQRLRPTPAQHCVFIMSGPVQMSAYRCPLHRAPWGCDQCSEADRVQNTYVLNSSLSRSGSIEDAIAGHRRTDSAWSAQVIQILDTGVETGSVQSLYDHLDLTASRLGRFDRATDLAPYFAKYGQREDLPNDMKGLLMYLSEGLPRPSRTTHGSVGTFLTEIASICTGTEQLAGATDGGNTAQGGSANSLQGPQHSVPSSALPNTGHSHEEILLDQGRAPEEGRLGNDPTDSMDDDLAALLGTG